MPGWVYRLLGESTRSHWQKCCSKLMAQYMPLLLDINFCRLPFAISPQEGISICRHSHTILISSLLPSCAFIPFLTAPCFPKPPISVLPHPCLLLPFLFHFPSFLFIFFLFHVFTWHAINTQCLSPNRWSFTLRDKKFHQNPPKPT